MVVTGNAYGAASQWMSSARIKISGYIEPSKWNLRPNSDNLTRDTVPKVYQKGGEGSFGEEAMDVTKQNCFYDFSWLCLLQSGEDMSFIELLEALKEDSNISVMVPPPSSQYETGKLLLEIP